MKTFKKVFEPILINKTEFSNRFLVSAMLSNLANEDGTVGERFIQYHEAKAKGGWGFIITENCVISPTAGIKKTLPGVYNEKQIESLKIFTERIHQAGGKIIAQIYHAGRAASSKMTGVQPIGPSAIRDVTSAEIPHELTVAEIHQLVEQFAQAALNVKKAGFDAVEIHGASGYLVSQFVSPYSNKRTDEYGGTTENRTRFAVEIIQRTRDLVGEDYPIFYRMISEEYVDGGLHLDEAKVVAQIIEHAGADMLHVAHGVFVTGEYITQPYQMEKGALIKNVAAIKKVVDIPVAGVGGHVNDPYMAESMLREGSADIITMARASLADPYLPLKTKEGRLEDIIYCIGCLQGCKGPKTNGIRCLMNPFTGRESELRVIPTTKTKKILVVGGGISGCEFAIYAAQKGHEVTILEQSNQLGGQWRIACIPNGKSEFASLISWQKEQLRKLGVQIELNTSLTQELLQYKKPDVLVDATGSVPFIPPVEGLRESAVHAYDVLLGKVETGRKVVVIGGGLVGAETAEFLAMQGKDVSIIEMMPEIAKEAVDRAKKLLLDSLEKYQVTLYPDTKLLKVNKDNIEIEHEKEMMVLSDIDTIVVATGCKSKKIDENLLRFFDGPIITIGDAAKTKNGMNNLAEAVKAACALD